MVLVAGAGVLGLGHGRRLGQLREVVEPGEGLLELEDDGALVGRLDRLVGVGVGRLVGALVVRRQVEQVVAREIEEPDREIVTKPGELDAEGAEEVVPVDTQATGLLSIRKPPRRE